MTQLQRLIRATVARDGNMQISVGTGSPANMGTIKALQRAGYSCTLSGHNGTLAVWRIAK